MPELTGVGIFRLLPKTNCKECNASNCLEFAMRVASGKSDFGECPHVSDDAVTTYRALSKQTIIKHSCQSMPEFFPFIGKVINFENAKRLGWKPNRNRTSLKKSFISKASSPACYKSISITLAMNMVEGKLGNISCSANTIDHTGVNRKFETYLHEDDFKFALEEMRSVLG
jgi:hypothetical protein